MSKPKITKTKSNPYRKVADELWDLAKEYSDNDMSDIGEVLKSMSDKLHDLARKHESEEDKKTNK